LLEQVGHLPIQRWRLFVQRSSLCYLYLRKKQINREKSKTKKDPLIYQLNCFDRLP